MPLRPWTSKGKTPPTARDESSRPLAPTSSGRAPQAYATIWWKPCTKSKCIESVHPGPQVTAPPPWGIRAVHGAGRIEPLRCGRPERAPATVNVQTGLMRVAGEDDRRRQEQWRLELNLHGQRVR